jgi:large subunit ribosomal protein L32
MGAVPNSKVGPRRKRLRRTHDKLTPPALVRCQTCNAYHQPHHICPTCGSYRGMRVIDLEDEG